MFVDANVLFSAAIGGGVSRLWELPGVHLVTSGYAAHEAHRNLDRAPDLERLGGLLNRTEIIEHGPEDAGECVHPFPDPSDIPIFTGARAAGCAFLVTGDKACFGAFFNKRLDGVEIIRPAELMARLTARD